MSNFVQWVKDHHGAMLAVMVILQNFRVIDTHLLQGVAAAVNVISG